MSEKKSKRHSKTPDGHKRRRSKMKIPPETESRLQEVFEQCDASHDGKINKREFIFAMRKHPDIADFFHLPHNIRQEDGTRDALEQLFQEIDDNHDREISWEELINHVSLFSSTHGEDSGEEDPAAHEKAKKRKSKDHGKKAKALALEDEAGAEPGKSSKSSKHRHRKSKSKHPSSEWAVYRAFPIGKDDRNARNKLFASIDVTGDGALIVGEFEEGLIRKLNMPDSAQPLVARGFDLVSATEFGPEGMISVINKKGFRGFLEYVSHTFEVMDAFQTTSDSTMTPDRSIDIRDLAAAGSQLTTLGVPVQEGQEMDIFDNVDPKHDGTVILANFCDWAAKKMLNRTREEQREHRSSLLAGRTSLKPLAKFPPMPSLSDLVKQDPDLVDPSWQQQLRKHAAQVDAIGDDYRRLVVTMEQKAHDMKMVLYEIFKDPGTALQHPSAQQLLDEVSAKLIDMQNDLKQIKALKECLKGSNLVECQQEIVDALRASQTSIQSFLAFQEADAQQILDDRRNTAEKYIAGICESEHMLKKLKSGMDMASLNPDSSIEELAAQQKMLDSSNKMIQHFLAVIKPHQEDIMMSSNVKNLSSEDQVGFQFLAEALGPAAHGETSGKHMKKTASRRIGRVQ